MAFDSVAWIKRADEVISKGDSSQAGASEATQFATSLLTALYGPQSTQLKAFSAGCDSILKMKQPGFGGVSVELCRHARGTITSAKAELEAGLIGNLRIQVTGEVLADLVSLGKEFFMVEPTCMCRPC